MPTKAQNSAARASRPPVPIPNEPDGVANAAPAAFACNAATSSGFMNHLSDSGLTRKLQMKPTTNIPARMYIVTS